MASRRSFTFVLLITAAGACARPAALDLPVPAASATSVPAVQPASLLWVDGSGRPTRAARETLAALDRAGDDGLDPAIYQVAALDCLAARLDAPGSGPPDRTAFDATLTAALDLYLRQLHNGRVDPRAIGFRITAPDDHHDFDEVVRAVASSGAVRDAIERLRPRHGQYAVLRLALARYRALAADEELAAPAPAASLVKPGQPYRDVDVLASFLLALGDLGADERARLDPARYDGPLVEAVRRFQRRHGIGADGVLGPQTFTALRVPLSVRVGQIELALERLRWLPHATGAAQLVVNIPTFRLWAWNEEEIDGVPAFGLDVIVGRALASETPLFVEEMREVIFRPYWNIPAGILRNEVLPKARADPGYLARNDMEIYGTDARGELRIRQRPGPKNALGLIKFAIPNHENVYMHGTPAPELFSRTRRDLSHGCIRVSDPMALAEWVLNDQPRWTRERILAAMAGTQPTPVRLTRPIRVVLFYNTAEVSPEDGTVHFADDIYRHDARVARALAARRLAP